MFSEQLQLSVLFSRILHLDLNKEQYLGCLSLEFLCEKKPSAIQTQLFLATICCFI